MRCVVDYIKAKKFDVNQKVFSNCSVALIIKKKSFCKTRNSCNKVVDLCKSSLASCLKNTVYLVVIGGTFHVTYEVSFTTVHGWMNINNKIGRKA